MDEQLELIVKQLDIAFEQYSFFQEEHNRNGLREKIEKWEAMLDEIENNPEGRSSFVAPFYYPGVFHG